MRTGARRRPTALPGRPEAQGCGDKCWCGLLQALLAVQSRQFKTFGGLFLSPAISRPGVKFVLRYATADLECKCAAGAEVCSREISTWVSPGNGRPDSLPQASRLDPSV